MAKKPEDKDDISIQPEVETEEEPAYLGEETREIILSSSILPERIFILPTGNKPVFPGIVFPLMVQDGYTAALLRQVIESDTDKVLGLVLTQNEETEETATEEIIHRELFRVGTLVRILKHNEFEGDDDEEGGIQVLLQAEKRFKIMKAMDRNGFLYAQVSYFEDIVEESEEIKALKLTW